MYGWLHVAAIETVVSETDIFVSPTDIFNIINPYQLFGVGALAPRGLPPFIGGLCGDHSPHRTTMTQTKRCPILHFGLWWAHLPVWTIPLDWFTCPRAFWLALAVLRGRWLLVLWLFVPLCFLLASLVCGLVPWPSSLLG